MQRSINVLEGVLIQTTDPNMTNYQNETQRGFGSHESNLTRSKFRHIKSWQTRCLHKRVSIMRFIISKSKLGTPQLPLFGSSFTHSTWINHQPKYMITLKLV